MYIAETERVYITDTTVERVYIPQNIYIEPTQETIAEPDIEEVPPRLVLGQAVIDPTRLNYLVGFSDSLSGQNVPLRHSQAVMIIFRLLTDESLAQVYSETGTFLDVSRDDWAYVFISTLQNAGVIVGVGGDLFLPERSLTRAEMVTLFARFVEPQGYPAIQLEHWSAGAIQTAVALGWLQFSGDFDPEAEVSVQEFIDFALSVLDWALE